MKVSKLEWLGLGVYAIIAGVLLWQGYATFVTIASGSIAIVLTLYTIWQHYTHRKRQPKPVWMWVLLCIWVYQIVGTIWLY